MLEPSSPRVNENQRARVTWVKDLMRKPPAAVRQNFRKLKRALGPEGLNALRAGVLRFNTIKETRRPLSSALRAELTDVFAEEVALLSHLLHRDLGHWVRSPSTL